MKRTIIISMAIISMLAAAADAQSNGRRQRSVNSSATAGNNLVVNGQGGNDRLAVTGRRVVADPGDISGSTYARTSRTSTGIRVATGDVNGDGVVMKDGSNNVTLGNFRGRRGVQGNYIGTNAVGPNSSSRRISSVENDETHTVGHDRTIWRGSRN